MNRAPMYELIYVDSSGFAETIWLLLAYADVEYKDTRISKDQWLNFQHAAPYGQQPTLKIRGIIAAAGSRAIARFLANKFGLVSDDALINAKCDMVVYALYELFDDLKVWFLEEDSDKKHTLLGNLIDGPVRPFVKYVNERLTLNGAAGFLFGETLTWADIAIAYGLDCINQLARERDLSVFVGYSRVQNHSDMILALPRIKAWMDRRHLPEV